MIPGAGARILSWDVEKMKERSQTFLSFAPFGSAPENLRVEGNEGQVILIFLRVL
jgi:hypothetical protein